MSQARTTFRVHALQRMFERNISVEEVESVLKSGLVIEDYPTDFPYPSRLLLGWNKNRPLHVVEAINRMDNESIVVTAYQPDPAAWDGEFKRRKP